MSKLTSSFFKLPALAQWGIIIGGAAALFFIGKRIIKGIEKNKEKKDEKDEIKDAEKEGQKMSYPLSQYATYADKLEQAMFDIGTDEEAIFAVFRAMKNDLDFLQLKKAFGSRQYSGGYVPGFFYGEYSLMQWIAEELSSSDISKLNTILRNNGIKYRF